MLQILITVLVLVIDKIIVLLYFKIRMIFIIFFQISSYIKFLNLPNRGSLTISSPLAFAEGPFILKRRIFENCVVLKYRKI
jgi:hypothetical protein